MPSVETSRSDSILTVTINRPEARNAVVCVRTGFRAMSNGGSPPKRPYATNTGVAWRWRPPIAHSTKAMGALHRRGHTQRIPAWPGGARQRRNCGRRAEIRGWRRAARGVGQFWRVKRGREAYYFVSGLTATSLKKTMSLLL